MKGMPIATRYLATLVLFAGCARADTVLINYANPIDLSASGSTTFSYSYTQGDYVGAVTFDFLDQNLGLIPQFPGYEFVGFDSYQFSTWSHYDVSGSPMVGGDGTRKWTWPVNTPEGPFEGNEFFYLPLDYFDGFPYHGVVSSFPTVVNGSSITAYFIFADWATSYDPNVPFNPEEMPPWVVSWMDTHYPAEITAGGVMVITVDSGLYEPTPEPNQWLLVLSAVAVLGCAWRVRHRRLGGRRSD